MPRVVVYAEHGHCLKHPHLKLRRHPGPTELCEGRFIPMMTVTTPLPDHPTGSAQHSPAGRHDKRWRGARKPAHARQWTLGL